MTLHRSSPRPIAGALGSLRDSWAPQTPLAEAQRAWRDAVGELIAAEARPVSDRGGVLTVSCSSAAWAHELDLLAPALLERLNRFMRSGPLTRMRCLVGG